MPARPTPGPRVRGLDDEGVAAVEFALVVPLLIVLLFTVVLAGSVYLDQLQLQSVARDAARVGSVAPAQACTVALSELSSNNVGVVNCSVVSDCSSGTMRVALDATQTFSVPLVGDRSVTLRASSSFACGE
jgi:Flp pilus assembly protein TadG